MAKTKNVTQVEESKIKRKTKFKTKHFPCIYCKKTFSEKTYRDTHMTLHSSARPFACDLCPHTSKTKKYLAKHVKVVHKPASKFKCEYCDKMFHYKSILDKHVVVHTNSKPNKCKVCGKGFNSGYSLSVHVLIHQNLKPHKCKYCDYACRDTSTLRKHHERHMGIVRRYDCSICDKRFAKKMTLQNHVAEVHMNIDIKQLPCDICGKKFKTIGKVNHHIKTVHKRGNATNCEICGMKIANKYNMSAHLLSHVDVKPYKCAFKGCTKRFKDRSALKKHTIIHYPDKQFPCKVCGKKFTRKHRLVKHEKQHVVKVKNVECDYCGVCFYNKNYLTVHIRKKHTGKLTLMCDMCDFVTNIKPSLIMHIKKHYRKTAKKCSICMKQYKRADWLKYHMWQAHQVVEGNETPYTVETDIKEEPLDVAALPEFELFEIEKEEVLDELNSMNDTDLDVITQNTEDLDAFRAEVENILQAAVPKDIVTENNAVNSETNRVLAGDDNIFNDSNHLNEGVITEKSSVNVMSQDNRALSEDGNILNDIEQSKSLLILKNCTIDLVPQDNMAISEDDNILNDLNNLNESVITEKSSLNAMSQYNRAVSEDGIMNDDVITKESNSINFTKDNKTTIHSKDLTNEVKLNKELIIVLPHKDDKNVDISNVLVTEIDSHSNVTDDIQKDITKDNSIKGIRAIMNLRRIKDIEVENSNTNKCMKKTNVDFVDKVIKTSEDGSNIEFEQSYVILTEEVNDKSKNEKCFKNNKRIKAKNSNTNEYMKKGNIDNFVKSSDKEFEQNDDYSEADLTEENAINKSKIENNFKNNKLIQPVISKRNKQEMITGNFDNLINNSNKEIEENKDYSKMELTVENDIDNSRRTRHLRHRKVIQQHEFTNKHMNNNDNFVLKDEESAENVDKEIEHKDEDSENENKEELEDIEYSKTVLSEDLTRCMNQRKGKEESERKFDEFFIEHVFDKKDLENYKRKEKDKDSIIDKDSQAYVKDYLDRLLKDTRINKEIKLIEKTRQEYNERMRKAKDLYKDKVSIKYFDKNKCKSKNNDNEDIINDSVTQNKDESNIEIEKQENVNIINKGDNKIPTEIIITNNKEDQNKSVESTNDNSNNTSTTQERDDNSDDKGGKETTIQSNSSSNNNDDSTKDRDGNNDSEGVKETNRFHLRSASGGKRKRYDVDDDIIDEGRNKKVTESRKIKLNTHQCYVCFKLYDTKEKLLDHCKDHFAVCNSTILKKCPLCDFVTTHLSITKHMANDHNIKITIPSNELRSKESDNGSKFCYKVNSSTIDNIDVIPSVKYLNKKAFVDIDRKNRKLKDTGIAKTKLVKKGNEWVVERNNIKVDNIDDFILPEFEVDEIMSIKIDTNDYLSRMKKLYRLAKRYKKKMLFPCESCDKICQSLCALKLHCRKHSVDSKPFKKKVWKHKMDIEQSVKSTKKVKKVSWYKKNRRVVEIDKIDENDKSDKIDRNDKSDRNDKIDRNYKVDSTNNNRHKKPKPVMNKHKCDPELIKFYETNIKGEDIEFWQFLKIFNKMTKENVNDFDDLQDKPEFGIHMDKPNTKIYNCDESSNKNDENDKKKLNTTQVEKQNTRIDNLVHSSKDNCNKSNKKTEDNSRNPKITKDKTKKDKDKFKRIIRISKKDYQRRNYLKQQLREKINKELNT
ncbi:uncharacterized protein [Epargyreus clarus]|uniref:uncharacterized protein n=1 Tax=Epargyreus clarus TaxID=520877 RepID=UPI003C2AF55E